MRLVFWLFLLLNLSFFYWQYSQPQKPAPQLVQLESLPAGVERLVLLRERGLGAQMPARVTDGLTTLQPISSSSAPAGGTPEHENSQRDVRENKTLGGKDQAALAELKPESEPSPAAEEISKAPPPVVMACFTLGPFKNEAAAGQMYKALLPLDIMVEQRLSERRIPKNYWVYLPPQKNYAEARRKVESLLKKGLDDMFIMGDGEMKNAISLGLFKRKSTATARFNQVHRMNSSTVMKTQYRVITEKWLDIKLDSTQTEKLANIEKLVDALPGVGFEQQNSCK